ncbi:ABC transporter substrate-binding protein [Pandoraea horticolens]|uniref:ABC transporter substrate-binding protein n=1 Tax=Pandoraea horticolens TaxID=2508298 RepID=A0A5E4VLG8_9BURK|nr:ABC transporter substrate-binding protein [Pandoraea horticolens]VVE13168.1 ABC transporter substrate-binding protein [Pandoraea horticolens]
MLPKLFAKRLSSVTLMCSLMASSVVANAETAVIGIANFGPHPALSRTISGFKEQLAKHGFIEGKTVTYAYSDANFTPGLIPQTLAQIVSQRPKVILTVTTPVAQAAVRNVSDARIPLVFSQVTNPIAAGLVPDWEHGSERIVGTASVTDYDAVLAFAKKIFPRAKSFGVLYNAGEVNDVAAIKSLGVAAEKAGMKMVATSVDTTIDVPQRTGTMKGLDFFYAIGSNLVQSSLPAVASVTDRLKMPILSAEHELIRKGNLIAVAYAPSYESQGAHAADLALALMNGKKPSELAVYRPQPGDYLALVNRKKLEQLGLTIPPEMRDCKCFVDPQ